jgi:hypothetical protein
MIHPGKQPVQSRVGHTDGRLFEGQAKPILAFADASVMRSALANISGSQ